MCIHRLLLYFEDEENTEKLITLSEAFYYLYFPKKADRHEIATWAPRKPGLRALMKRVHDRQNRL